MGDHRAAEGFGGLGSGLSFQIILEAYQAVGHFREVFVCECEPCAKVTAFVLLTKVLGFKPIHLAPGRKYGRQGTQGAAPAEKCVRRH